MGNLTNQALEGQLPDEELSGLLVLADLAESDRSGSEAMGLLDTSSGGLERKRVSGWRVGRDRMTTHRCRLLGLLGRKLLARGFATGRLAGSLLRTKVSDAATEDK